MAFTPKRANAIFIISMKGDVLKAPASAISSAESSAISSAVRGIGVRIWIWIWIVVRVRRGIRVRLWNDYNLRASSSTEKDRISLILRNRLITLLW
jgi:hypothetical protein